MAMGGLDAERGLGGGVGVGGKCMVTESTWLPSPLESLSSHVDGVVRNLLLSGDGVGVVTAREGVAAFFFFFFLFLFFFGGL